jgi:hypothetical protein
VSLGGIEVVEAKDVGMFQHSKDGDLPFELLEQHGQHDDLGLLYDLDGHAFLSFLVHPQLRRTPRPLPKSLGQHKGAYLLQLPRTQPKRHRRRRCSRCSRRRLSTIRQQKVTNPLQTSYKKKYKNMKKREGLYKQTDSSSI